MNKKELKEKNAKYYVNNREKIIERVKKRLKETNYKAEKTKKQRILRSIKRMTRARYPLEYNKCFICSANAKERHHIKINGYIVVDRFLFLCKKCHKELHHNEI